MTRNELIKEVARRASTTNNHAERMLDAVLAGLSAGVHGDGKVQLIGFGTFEVKTRAARETRNPQTGEMMTVPETRVVQFRPGAKLREEATS